MFSVAAWFPGGATRFPPALRPGRHADLPGQTPHCPRRRRRIVSSTPHRAWRTSRARARSSRVSHTSSPVPVRRPASLDWASSRPHLAVDALALLLAFGCANTWHGDLHPVSAVPCPAHTPAHEPRGLPRRLHALVRCSCRGLHPFALFCLQRGKKALLPQELYRILDGLDRHLRDNDEAWLSEAWPPMFYRLVYILL